MASFTVTVTKEMSTFISRRIVEKSHIIKMGRVAVRAKKYYKHAVLYEQCALFIMILY